MAEAHPNHFAYGRMPLPDTTESNLLELLPDALEFLCEARGSGGCVFVHCAKGISRSASCVIALLMFERGLSFSEAWQTCKQKRPIVYPNVGFQEQLKHFESLLSCNDRTAPWPERLRQLRPLVPRGSLEEPGSHFKIHDAIGQAMGAMLGDLEAFLEEAASEPDMSQRQAEVWKRHGPFFENVQLYHALPSDQTLLQRTRLTAEKVCRFASGGKAVKGGGSAANKALALDDNNKAMALGKMMLAWVNASGPSLGQGKLLLGGEYDSDSESEERDSGRRSRSRSPNKVLLMCCYYCCCCCYY
ncbi:unnamed protein product [Polarella glacialis]|nr:unnamed protein product [Polarella glacialis]